MLLILPRLRRFALSLTRRADLADDLVQSTCEKALANQSSWQPGTRFDAWMFRIMRNAWIDTYRRKKTAGTHDDLDLHPDIPGEAGNVAETRLTLKAVWNAIGSLPGQQREVLLLVCVEELTYAEAAEVLSVPVGTVMSRLARAREKVAQLAGIEPAAKR